MAWGCSRHWFFGAKLVLDGQPMPRTLMQIVKDTLKQNPRNSVIGFKDNSSAIRCKLRSCNLELSTFWLLSCHCQAVLARNLTMKLHLWAPPRLPLDNHSMH